MKKWLLFAMIALPALGLQAQSYAFGLKGGLTGGLQQWNGFERDVLFKYHGIAFIETYSEEEPFALFAQAGYHVKGSALRNRNFFNPLNQQFFRPPTREFRFNNLSLTLGAKQKFDLGIANKLYWLLGIRGDYTLSTNLGQYDELNNIYGIFPFDDDQFIRRLNYGITAGGGIDFSVADLVGVVLEFTINPDFSYQYVQPAIPNVLDPFTGNSRTLPERQIRNLTFEITLGFRFLHIIEYVD